MKTWVKKAWSVMATLCLMTGMLPVMALAADDTSVSSAEPTVNLALNKTVECSSWTEDNRENGAHNAEKAVDGKTASDDKDSRWASSSTDNQWITVDLGKSCYITKVVLQWETARAATYRLQVSDDNSKWNDIYAYDNTDSADTANTNGSIDTITTFDTETTGRYIRMYGETRTTNYGFSIYEFEVYGWENVALNKTATANSQDNDQHPFQYATDGDISTRWASKSNDNEWVYVDLGQSYSVKAISLKWEAAYALAYKLQVSNDPTNANSWMDIYDTTDGKGGNELIDVFSSPMTGRYIRMQGVDRATNYGYSLYEFEIYGQPSLTHGKEAVASYEEPNTTHTASQAFDSDSSKDSRWSSNKAPTNDQWIYVDLKGIYSLTSVVLKWEAAYATKYKLQVSNDAKVWTDIYTTDAGTGGNEYLSVSGTGRYLRMLGVTPSGTYGYSLYEFEAYGTLVAELDELAVSFKGKFDQEIYTTTVNSGDELATLLETVKAPDLGGYTFCGWSESDAELLFDTYKNQETAYPITAVYSVGDKAGERKQYTVTVGSNILSTNCTITDASAIENIYFDHRVELTVVDECAGQVAYWVLDNQPMAYEQDAFTFYVTGTNTVSVVLKKDAGDYEKTASVNIQQYATSVTELDGVYTYTLSVIAQTYVPTGTATEFGVYYTASTDELQKIKDADSSAKYLQAKSSKSGNDQQYMTHLLGVKAGKTRYAMAYAVIGKTTVYSTTVLEFTTNTDGTVTVTTL